jgi:hypothetical protein
MLGTQSPAFTVRLRSEIVKNNEINVADENRDGAEYFVLGESKSLLGRRELDAGMQGAPQW